MNLYNTTGTLIYGPQEAPKNLLLKTLSALLGKQLFLIELRSNKFINTLTNILIGTLSIGAWTTFSNLDHFN